MACAAWNWCAARWTQANCPRACSTRPTSIVAARCLTKRSIWRDAAAMSTSPHSRSMTAKTPGAPRCLQRYFDSGAPAERVSVSSDAGGCLPCFDAQGHHLQHGCRLAARPVCHPGRTTAARRTAGGRPCPPSPPIPRACCDWRARGASRRVRTPDLVVLDARGAVRGRDCRRRVPPARGDAGATRKLRSLSRAAEAPLPSRHCATRSRSNGWRWTCTASTVRWFRRPVVNHDRTPHCMPIRTRRESPERRVLCHGDIG
jgi:hypothetical protein